MFENQLTKDIEAFKNTYDEIIEAEKVLKDVD